MKLCGLIAGFFLLTISCSAQEVKYDKIDNRRLAIYLPEGYDESVETYKTVYLYDGQASFTNNPFSWKLHDQITNLIAAGKIEKIIAVGIYTDVTRTEDLIPYYDPYVAENWGTYKARGNRFASFVVNTIIPYIEQNYRVKKEGKDRALIGMAFGGLHALYNGLENPTSFGLVAGISPTLWVDNNHFTKDTRKATVGPKIWFDLGSLEWENYFDIIGNLIREGYTYGTNLFYLEVEGAKHESKFWIPRFEYPLILFAGSKDSEITGIEIKIEVTQSNISKKEYFRINPVATRADGVKFSLATQAVYELENPKSGTVNSDGSFELKNNSDLEVKVSYNNWQEKITITAESIQQKRNN